MGFDLNTARPVDEKRRGGFDISTARPITASPDQKQLDRDFPEEIHAAPFHQKKKGVYIPFAPGVDFSDVARVTPEQEAEFDAKRILTKVITEDEVTKAVQKEADRIAQEKGIPFPEVEKLIPRDQVYQQTYPQVEKAVEKNFIPLSRQYKHLTGFPGAQHTLPELVSAPAQVGIMSSLTAGFLANPIQTTTAVGLFKAIDKALPVKKLFPNASFEAKQYIDMLDFIGKAALTGAIYKKAPGLLKKATKYKIVKENLPKTLKISWRDIEDMHRNGELTSVEKADAYKTLSPKGTLLRKARRAGALDITIPAEKVTVMVDKPWYQKIKRLFRIGPKVGVSVERLGNMEGRPSIPVRGIPFKGKEGVAPWVKQGIEPFLGRGKAPLPPTEKPIVPPVTYREPATSFGRLIKRQIEKKENIPLHPAEAGREGIEKMFGKPKTPVEASKPAPQTKKEEKINSALKIYQDAYGIESINITPTVLKSGNNGFKMTFKMKNGEVVEGAMGRTKEELEELKTKWINSSVGERGKELGIEPSVKWVDIPGKEEKLRTQKIRQDVLRKEYNQEQYIRRRFTETTRKVSELEYRKKQGLPVDENELKIAKKKMNEAVKIYNNFYAESTKPAPQTKDAALIEEAKKYKSAEEFTKALDEGQAGLYVEYAPIKRLLEKNIGNYNLTKVGFKPEQKITVYRGVPKGKQRKITSGDYVATSKELALSYTAGEENVISKKIKAKDFYFDKTAGFTKKDFEKGIENLHIEGVYNPAKPITKSQLINIWNKAHKTPAGIESPTRPEARVEEATKREEGTVGAKQRNLPFVAKPVGAKITEVSGMPKYSGPKLTSEQANAVGIANKEKTVFKDGEEVTIKKPAIRRKSGIFAEKDFEEFSLQDAGGKTDTLTSWAAAADGVEEGSGFGPAYKKLAAVVYKAVADRNDFVSNYARMIHDLAKKNKMFKGPWRVLAAKDGKMIFKALEGKTPINAKPEHKMFEEGLREFYDDLRKQANIVRKELGKKEIGYIENYASHIRDVSLYQRLIKQFQTTIDENFDYIIPNEKKNPFAMKRIGNMRDKIDNVWKILDPYIQAVASDIYISPVIEKIKAVASVLEGRGHYKSKNFLEQYIRNNLLKKPDTIDNYIGLREGSIIRRIAGKVIHARLLSALAANLQWMFFTQPMSMANTLMKTNIINTVRGALSWVFSPSLRKELDQLTAMRLKSKAGVVSSGYGDIDTSARKIYTGRIDKFNKLLSLLGDSLEYHLTGMSAAAGLYKGKQYGLTGKNLNLYADYIAQVTQSMYNPETRMRLLNSMAVRTGFPFQTFPGEMFRHLRTLTGKGGGLPLNMRQRLGHVINLIIGTLIVNYINKKVRGRNLQTIGSFIPLVGGFVDEMIARASGKQYWGTRMPVAPAEDIRKLVDASVRAVKHGDLSKLRRELIFWGAGLAGIGGGAQASRTIDGLIALEKGRVDDVRGRKLFEVNDWSAIWKGPWGTKGGREYWEKRSGKAKAKPAKTTPQKRKFRYIPTNAR